MNDSIKFLENIQSSFKKLKLILWTFVTLCALVTLTVVIADRVSYHRLTDALTSRIYLLDQGSVLSASRADNQAQRDLEVIDHVTRFHELFFNMAPNVTAINQNLDKAFDLADASARTYYNDLSESKFYSHLIQVNATQQISVDSVAVNMNVIPYHVTTFASRYIIRESNITRYEMVTTCEVMESTRTTRNPHGLMMTKFFVEKDEVVETRRR